MQGGAKACVPLTLVYRAGPSARRGEGMRTPHPSLSSWTQCKEACVPLTLVYRAGPSARRGEGLRTPHTSLSSWTQCKEGRRHAYPSPQSIELDPVQGGAKACVPLTLVYRAGPSARRGEGMRTPHPNISSWTQYKEGRRPVHPSP